MTVRLKMAFGQELILDMIECDTSKFNRDSLKEFFIKLCDLIEMEREDLYFWDYEGVPEEEIPSVEHLKGTSAIQFIRTSNITIHTLDMTGNVYLNIFSCKEYDAEKASQFVVKFFNGKIVNQVSVERC